MLATFGNQVRLVWKDYPLSVHADARRAAQAARCALDQNKFWEYHDKLFDNQDKLSVASLKRYGAQLRMDARAFDACVDSNRYKDLVEADIQKGNRYGVSSTPTIFINGRIVIGGAPYEVYEQIIREEIARNGLPPSTRP